MSKLSFRARALDPSKPMPIYLAEEIPDLPEYSAINRAVPQMPSGMEKEEESEHHLQRAICTGLIIPTPEVFTTESEFYEKLYPATYKMPRQMIHMQPLGLEQDIPDYDVDSADEEWLDTQSQRLDINSLKFEQMMDRLEKSSGQTVVTLNEAKLLLKQDDEISIAVYDYWLNKRLKLQHPLILAVKTENRSGTATNNPYLAFRRRTEKMQTRKNRKNDEASYEKMLKLRRDLSRAVGLLDLIKKREKLKRENLTLSVDVFEKRYQSRDYSGQLIAEFTNSLAKQQRPTLAQLYGNQYGIQNVGNQWSGHHMHYGNNTAQFHAMGTGTSNKRDMDGLSSSSSRKEKRQYKKRKHKASNREQKYQNSGPTIESMISSEEEDTNGNHLGSESEDEGAFTFRRTKNCQYQRPLTSKPGNWPWESKEVGGGSDPRYRFTLASIRHRRLTCIGFARKRLGRGGRVILDRMSTNYDDMWANLGYTIFDSVKQDSSQIESNSLKDKHLSCVDSEQRQKLIEPNNEIVIDLIEPVKNTSEHSLESPSVANTNNMLSANAVNRTKLQSGALVNTINTNSNATQNMNRIENNVIKSEQNKINIHLNKNQSANDFNNMLGLVGNQSINNITITNSDNNSVVNNRYVDSAGIRSRATSLTEEIANGMNRSRPESRNNIVENNNSVSVTVQQYADTLSNPPLNSNDKDSNRLNAEEQQFSDLLQEIQEDWVHFRPQTPTADDEFRLFDGFGEDLADFTETTPLGVELQSLSAKTNCIPVTSNPFPPSDESVFTTRPIVLNEILDGSRESTNSGNGDINASGADSLTELNLSLGDNEANDKMLENILDELGSNTTNLETNTNFWNGILEGNLLDVINTEKKVNPDRRETDVELLNSDEVNNRLTTSSNRKRSTVLNRTSSTHRFGGSEFKIRSIPKDEFFKKDDESKRPKTHLNDYDELSILLGTKDSVEHIRRDNTIVPMVGSSVSIPANEIKVEPVDNDELVILPNADVLPTIKQEVIESTKCLMPSNLFPSKQMIFQHAGSGESGTIILHTTNSPLRKGLTSNGPSIQQILKQNPSLVNRKVRIQSKIEEIQNTAVASNHNYSLAPQSQGNVITIQPQQQSIAVIGNTNIHAQNQLTPLQHNKIIINTQSGSNNVTGDTKLGASGSRDRVTESSFPFNKIIPTTNIKLNILPTIQTSATGNLMDTKMILTNSGNGDGKQATAIITTAHSTTNPQQGNRFKMVLEPDKRGYIYATGFKNRPGSQLVAQLNPKVVNIKQFQHKNNIGSVQNIVSGTDMISKIQAVHRRVTQQNDSSNMGNSSGNVDSVQTNVTPTIRQTTSGSTSLVDTHNKLNIQKSDAAAAAVTGINVNTNNR